MTIQLVEPEVADIETLEREREEAAIETNRVKVQRHLTETLGGTWEVCFDGSRYEGRCDLPGLKRKGHRQVWGYVFVSFDGDSWFAAIEDEDNSIVYDCAGKRTLKEAAGAVLAQVEDDLAFKRGAEQWLAQAIAR